MKNKYGNIDLIGELNSLGMDVNCKFKQINYGGCGVYAALVGKALQDMNVKVKVLLAGAWHGCDSHVDEARKFVKNVGRKRQWCDNGVSFGHVGLEFYWKGRKYHYDSNGCHKPEKSLDGCLIYKGRLTVEECIAVAREREGWNESFNRRGLPTLRKMVKDHFDQMKAKA